MIKACFPCIVFLVFLPGCQSNPATVGPLPIGDLIGNVEVYHIISVSASQNVSPAGVLIQLEHTSYSVYSDSNGFWKISGVQAGTYNITASKPGYSSAIIQSHPFVGGIEPDFAGYLSLYDLPSTYVKSIDSVRTNQVYLIVFGTLSSTVLSQRAVVFVATDSNLVDLQSNYITFVESTIYSSDSFNAGIELQELKTLGVNSGTKICLVAYMTNDAVYRDVRTQRLVFTGLCATPSRIVSYVIP